jgi:hypothetical protein
VLSRETGFQRQYGLNPYTGYDTIGQSPFLIPRANGWPPAGDGMGCDGPFGRAGRSLSS